MLEKIKELRERTHLGLTECKKALEECNGNINEAIFLLQKKGTVKKVDDLVKLTEGTVRVFVPDGNVARVVIVTCQTDFAAKTELFNKFVDDLLLNNVPANNEAPAVGNFKIGEELDILSKQLGEAVHIKQNDKFISKSVFEFKNSTIFGSYNHHNNKIGVLVELKVPNSTSNNFDKVEIELANNIAMHIAANKPKVISRDKLSIELINNIKQLFLAQLKEDSKPKSETATSKILEGKLNKWYSEVCLLEQPYILEPKKKIQDVIKEVSDKISIESFQILELKVD